MFAWEKNTMNCLIYFVNKFILNIECLKKSDEEKILDRYYFLLEHGNFSGEVKNHLSLLFKHFQRYKVKDLRFGECIDDNNFQKFAKDVGITPVFLSSKDIVYIINFVKYKKKSLIPNNYFNFCSFVEIICLIAFQAYIDFNKENNKTKLFVSHLEKIKNFMEFLSTK